MELKAYRVAGTLYLANSSLGFLIGLGFSLISTAIGLALLLIQDESRLDWLRFVVFAWVVIGIVIVLVGAGSAGYWSLLVSTLLFGGAIAGLMLNDLSQQSIATLAAIGAAGIFLPILQALV